MDYVLEIEQRLFKPLSDNHQQMSRITHQVNPNMNFAGQHKDMLVLTTVDRR